MKVVSLSMVFPSQENPLYGIFVKERLRHVRNHTSVVVLNPVPFFPFRSLFGSRSPIPRGGEEDVEGIPVHHLPFLSIPGFAKFLDGLLLFLSCLFFLRKLRKRYPFQLIDAHFIFPEGFAAVLLGKIFRVPVFITLRGTLVLHERDSIKRLLIRYALRKASRIIAVSEDLKQRALRYGIPGAKAVVIPNGVDTRLFQFMDKRESRARCGLPLEGKVIVSVGSLIERKGFHRIVEVLPQLKARFGTLRLVLIGGPSPEGDYSPALLEKIRECGVEKEVLLKGPKPYSELPLWLNAGDCFCLATSWEGWANVFLEALACGLPVVTTDVGGNREIISSGKLGIIVKAGDKNALSGALMEALLRDWDHEEIRRHAERFSWEEAGRRTFEEFRGVFRKQPPPGGP